MRTISEIVDDETYIDLIIEPNEIDQLHNRSMEPVRLILNGSILNIWVRTATPRELYGDGEFYDE